MSAKNGQTSAVSENIKQDLIEAPLPQIDAKELTDTGIAILQSELRKFRVLSASQTEPLQPGQIRSLTDIVKTLVQVDANNIKYHEQEDYSEYTDEELAALAAEIFKEDIKNDPTLTNPVTEKRKKQRKGTRKKRDNGASDTDQV